MKVILASNSITRKRLLEKSGFKVKVIRPRIKEINKRSNSSFKDIVKLNALRKLEDVRKKVKKGVIVAADTLVFSKKDVLAKPRSKKEAKRMWDKLCHKPHWVYTGLAILDKNTGSLHLDYEKTKVFMHRLSAKEIDAYFKSDSPLRFSGALDIQGKGALYIKRIEGCFSNVVGLPLAKLFSIFKKMGLMLILFISIPYISGCTEFNPVTQRQEMIFYSTDREINIGRNLSRQVEKEYKLVKNPVVIDRVNRIAKRIASVADRQDVIYQVKVIQAKEEEKEEGADINAFALPGGYIYLYDGLVDFVDNDDQLAGVIAHEVGHIVAKHGIKKLQASMGYTLLNIAAISTQDAQFVQGLNYAILNILLAYSREDELLADKLGVRYAKEAGYKPRAMIDFLDKLREKKKKDPLRAKSIYRTHPYFSQRIAEIKKELGEPLTIGDYVSIVNDSK